MNFKQMLKIKEFKHDFNLRKNVFFKKAYIIKDYNFGFAVIRYFHITTVN